jgi:hypothetical protein
MQIEEPSILLDNALKVAGQEGAGWFAAELNRHKGRLLMRQGHAEVAEELYRDTLRIAPGSRRPSSGNCALR